MSSVMTLNYGFAAYHKATSLVLIKLPHELPIIYQLGRETHDIYLARITQSRIIRAHQQ